MENTVCLPNLHFFNGFRLNNNDFTGNLLSLNTKAKKKKSRKACFSRPSNQGRRVAAWGSRILMRCTHLSVNISTLHTICTLSKDSTPDLTSTILPCRTTEDGSLLRNWSTDRWWLSEQKRHDFSYVIRCLHSSEGTYDNFYIETLNNSPQKSQLQVYI